MLIRASIGTLSRLGLASIKTLDEPLTAYFLQYSENGCLARCGFCTQSRSNVGRRDWLGKVVWPAVELEAVINAWRDEFKRVCFQTVLKKGFIDEVRVFLREITRVTSLPISLAITPVHVSILREFRSLGVSELGIGLDALTKELFIKWGKPYTWEVYWRFIRDAVEVFGKGNVYVHVIAGLGESLEEALATFRKIYSMGARVALFNYFDTRSMRSIDVKYYRILQVALGLIEEGKDPLEYIDVSAARFTRQPDIDVLKTLYTRGCPNCNRPFYTDLPREVYNFPSTRLLETYRARVVLELEEIGVKI